MGGQRKACLLVLLVALAIQSAAALGEIQLPSTIQPGSLSPSGEPAQASPRPRPRPSPEQLRFLPASDSPVIDWRPQIEVILPPDLPGPQWRGRPDRLYRHRDASGPSTGATDVSNWIVVEPAKPTAASILSNPASSGGKPLQLLLLVP